MKQIILLATAILMSVGCFAQENKGKVVEINQAEFTAKVAEYAPDGSCTFKTERPVVVDFNATWCGPCRRLAPILEKLANQYKGKVDFYSIDVDKNKDLARAMGIQSIPYVVFFPVKGEIKTLIGLRPEEEVNKIIQSILPVE